jgi:hypothetical protein
MKTIHQGDPGEYNDPSDNDKPVSFRAVRFEELVGLPWSSTWMSISSSSMSLESKESVHVMTPWFTLGEVLVVAAEKTV